MIVFKLILLSSQIKTIELPYHGFIMPSSQEATPVSATVSQIFQNPAWLAGENKHQYKIDASTPLLGYKRLDAAASVCIGKINIGGGYLFYGADDLYKTNRNTDRKASVGNQFKFANNIIKGSISYPIKNLELGIVGSYYQMNIDNQRAESFTVDLGGLLFIKHNLWVGGYTRNLVPMTFDFDKSTPYKDKSNQEFVVEAGAMYWKILVKVLTDLTYGRAYIMKQVYNVMDLNADILINQERITRIGIGIDMKLNKLLANNIIISYDYFHMFLESMNSQQHLFGITLENMGIYFYKKNKIKIKSSKKKEIKNNKMREGARGAEEKLNQVLKHYDE